MSAVSPLEGRKMEIKEEETRRIVAKIHQRDTKWGEEPLSVGGSRVRGVQQTQGLLCNKNQGIITKKRRREKRKSEGMEESSAERNLLKTAT